MKVPDYVEIRFDDAAWQKKGLLLPAEEGTEKPRIEEKLKVRFSRKHKRYHNYEVVCLTWETNRGPRYLTKIGLSKI